MTEKEQEKEAPFLQPVYGENKHKTHQRALHFSYPSETNEDSTLSLLEEASSQAPIIAPELETQRIVAADPNQLLEDRLEAYEDIIDSEVGDTTLSRSRNVEREVGLRQIYLKFEGSTPTGTQKDRIAFALAMDAMRRQQWPSQFPMAPPS